VGNVLNFERTLLKAVLVSELAAPDESAKNAIAAENESLRETTAAKYDAAEKSSAALARPSVTADLFLKAQNEVLKVL
jgi:hypothetical protein